MKSADQTLEHAGKPDDDHLELQVVAVNDNGMMLLEWFRLLAEDERAGVMKVVSVTAERLRH